MTGQRPAETYNAFSYRKKPAVIEAFPWNPPGLPMVLPSWWNDEVGKRAFINSDGSVHIQTLEGLMRANPGDWIIRGVVGELYPCKPNIFEATYEHA